VSYPESVLERLAKADTPWLNAGDSVTRLGVTLAGTGIREIWKYTPIKSFVEAFADPQNGSSLVTAGLEQPGIQASDFAELSDTDLLLVRECLESLDGTCYPMADLTVLDTADGRLLKVAGEPAEPLVLETVQAGRHATVIDVAAGARLTLVEDSSAADFNSQLVFLRLGPGAHVQHTRTALMSSAMQWSLLMAELDGDSAYTLQQYQTGGRKRRTDCHIKLNGRGASAELTGAYLTEDGCHLDQQVIIEHRAPETTSRQKFHGIGTGKSRAVFNGRIHIHHGASASDALLTNRNLSLNPGAEIDTKPELEIYTDDVRCAHGATVGQLSEESLFYLRSRGITETAARALLCRGFLRECIAGPSTDTVTARLTGALQ